MNERSAIERVVTEKVATEKNDYAIIVDAQVRGDGR